MKIRSIFLFMLYIGICLLIVWWISGTTIFDFIKLISIWGIVALITLITGILKKRLWIYPGSFLIAITLAIIISFPFRSYNLNTKSKNAQRIIEKINDYKLKTGKYPLTISEVSDHESDIYIYWIDTLNEEFEISYNMDGWHRRQYDSKTKTWMVVD